ncbi:MAG: DUF1080 domain-containing protein [Bacteroidia bacterium]
MGSNRDTNETLLYLAGILVTFTGLIYLLRTATPETPPADDHAPGDITGLSLAKPQWEALFDGCDLKGWAVVERPAKVSVTDSSMVLNMTVYTSRHSFVRTNEKYKDFIFEVDFKRDSSIDSGILFRSENTPDTAFSALFGYMVKIDPSPTRRWTGGVFLDYGNGLNWLYPLEGDERAQQAEKAGGTWNHLRIEAIGEDIKVWLNDIPTAHLTDDKYCEGYIAFKIHYLMHDKEQEKLEIAYRNARIITQNPELYTMPMDLPAKNTKEKLDITYFR